MHLIYIYIYAIYIYIYVYIFNLHISFPGGPDGKGSACNARDLGLIPELGRSPGEGKGYPLQFFLAWRIPWIVEPGGLQFMGSQITIMRLSTQFIYLSN